MIRQLLLIILVLHLGSCNKKYLFLKKIKVDQQPQSAITVKPSTNLAESESRFGFNSTPSDMEGIQSAGIITQPDITFTQPDIITPKQDSTSPRIPSVKYAKQKNIGPSQNLVADPTPKPQKNYSLLSFIFAIVALAGVFLIFLLPFLGFLLTFILAAMAFDYGQKALKAANNSSKWMSLTGVIVGALILSTVIALVVSALLFFSSTSVSDTAAILTVSIMALGIFALMLRSTFHKKKKKQAK